MIFGAMEYLTQGIEAVPGLSDFVKDKTGSPLFVTSNARAATAPCALISASSCKYAVNMGRGTAEFLVAFVLPLFDDDARETALEIADLVGTQLYFSAGRGAHGHRITSVAMVGMEEDLEKQGLWIVTFSVAIDR